VGTGFSARPDRKRGAQWAVVGGGMLGLTLAHRLQQQGKQVTLFESAHELGGLASAWSLGRVVWDRHYHVTLMSDASLRAVLGELGLEREICWNETRTGVFDGERVHSVSNTLELLRFPTLNLIDIARLGSTVLYASRIRDWERLEQIPVADWLQRWSGRRAFERFWLPLLHSKLGAAYRDTSAAFIWATIQRLYAARRGGMKKEMFGYVPGGYARVVAAFGDLLRREGVRIELGCTVKHVTPSGGGVAVDSGRGAQRFDHVVVTAAAPVAARLCEGLNDDERARLVGVRYLGVACASVLLRNPLEGYYVTNLLDSAIPFTGVIEMSALVDRGQFGGNTLVYIPRYLEPTDPFFDRSDDDVRTTFLDGLKKVYPSVRDEDVLAFRVSRVRLVMALSTLAYSRRCPPMDTSVPGLHLASSANICNGTLNVNETIQLAESAARRFVEAA
jgi:protoporphyrinogen oxidase